LKNKIEVLCHSSIKINKEKTQTEENEKVFKLNK